MDRGQWPGALPGELRGLLSATVFFDDKKAGRMGDPAKTCNDPTDAPNGVVIASGTVLIG